jgi:hypothetical protein
MIYQVINQVLMDIGPVCKVFLWKSSERVHFKGQGTMVERKFCQVGLLEAAVQKQSLTPMT